MLDQITENQLKNRLSHLLSRSNRQLTEIEQDIFVRGGDYPKYALEEGKLLYSYVNEILTILKKLEKG